MLRIACPWCGPRDEIEFHCGGQSRVPRPQPWAGASDAEIGAYFFLRDNPKGVHHERWVHAAGCRQWFNVARDTVTHEVIAVYRLDENPPG
jgi:heterotetrameric sarcosine oxidase delta subunit